LVLTQSGNAAIIMDVSVMIDVSVVANTLLNLKHGPL